MDENVKKDKSSVLKRILSVAAFVLALAMIFSIPIAAWFITQQKLAAYAPVSSPESLYIGAGHIDTENELFEEVSYLYLSGIDVTKSADYYDYVFCVYGRAVNAFKLQLAYTTNNQFSYEIYHAAESDEYSEGAVPYTTHGASPTTYYYTIDTTIHNTNPVRPIEGSFLNAKTVLTETLGKDSSDEALLAAESRFHTRTYDTYSSSFVNKYAEPLYWQSTYTTDGSTRGNFVEYFILRVYKNGKESNDRETDIICIAAKSHARVVPSP